MPSPRRRRGERGCASVNANYEVVPRSRERAIERAVERKASRETWC